MGRSTHIARLRSGTRPWSRCLSPLLLSLAALAPVARAQTPQAPPADDAHPYTLHVYEDLVQVATLVLDTRQESYPGLTRNQFFVQLDDGPRFHPKQVHIEGDDPLTLALLLDARGKDQQRLIGQLDAAIAKLPPGLLSARDHVSIYAFDCTLDHTANDMPADAPAVQAALRKSLTAPALHAAKGTRCPKPVHLWDAAALVLTSIAHLPGRRILLVASDGFDGGSANSPEGVERYATAFSISLFGLRPSFRSPALTTGGVPDTFAQVSGETGGAVLDLTPDTFAPMLQRTFEYIRHRYILEFARPSNGTSGQHRIDVTLANANAIIRPGGVAVPVKDKALLDDPTVVPNDTTADPVIGRHKKNASHP